jgi:hypothetical protein
MMVEAPVTNKTDVLIYAVEINDRHGVGILVQRIFPDSEQIISVRTLDIYDGEHKFGGVQLQISHAEIDRAEGVEKVKQALAGYQIDRVICIPYTPDEVLTALALHQLYGASICTYIMDDRNVLISDIPDDLMGELLAKSKLCLGISPEMCDVYRGKYGIDMHFAPPVLPNELINPDISQLSPETIRSTKGAMIGNIWSPGWLELLRQMTKSAGANLDWYGNTGAEWNINTRAQLQADGISEKGFLPTELEVANVLRQYSYVVVPSGTLDERDDKPSTSWLSLPSRIPFILASSHTPIIVLGHSETAAARFVRRWGIGVVADYNGDSFRQAVDYLTQPEIQEQLRTQSASIAPLFANRRTDEWIWQSLDLGEPVDRRFDQLLTNKLDYSNALAQSFTARSAEQQQMLNSHLREFTSLQQQILSLQQKSLSLQQEILGLQQQIRSMESTKFWKLRKRWFELKKIARIHHFTN